MRSTLVLFDVDGTLVDTAGAGKFAVERAFVELFGCPGITERTGGVRFAGMTDPRIFAALAEAAGIATGTYEQARDRLYACYLEELRVEMRREEPRRRVLPGVRALLDELERRPRTYLGLLTGNLERGARLKLEPFGLNPYFAEGGYGSDHFSRREIARLASAKLSRRHGVAFRAADVVVVGDTEHDVDCAKANGYRSVAVAAGWVPREVLDRSRPDALLDDLADLDRGLEALGLDAREGKPC